MTRTTAYGVAVAVFLVDRLTKWIIETRLSMYDVITVIPGFFDIVHARNTGAAFSMFADSESPWRTTLLILFSAVALVVIGWMLRNASKMDIRSAVALSLILGGALGNVFDRAVMGSVTDFLDFYVGSWHWPSFNVADSAIVIGSCLLLLDAARKREEPART